MYAKCVRQQLVTHHNDHDESKSEVVLFNDRVAIAHCRLVSCVYGLVYMLILDLEQRRES